MHDSDLANAAVLAARHPAAAGAVFNVSDGHVHTLADIINAIYRGASVAGLHGCTSRSARRAPRRVSARLRVRVIGVRPPVTRSLLEKYTEDVAVDGTLIQRDTGIRAVGRLGGRMAGDHGVSSGPRTAARASLTREPEQARGAQGMLSYVLGAGGAGFLASVALVAAARSWARRCTVLDHPNDSSLHLRPTPRGGGIGIVLPMCVAIGGVGVLVPESRGAAAWLAGGGLLVAAVGLVDDVRGLPAVARLVAHVAAAAVIVLGIGSWRGGRVAGPLGTRNSGGPPLRSQSCW